MICSISAKAVPLHGVYVYTHLLKYYENIHDKFRNGISSPNQLEWYDGD